jgi:hypothetical protein
MYMRACRSEIDEISWSWIGGGYRDVVADQPTYRLFMRPASNNLRP